MAVRIKTLPRVLIALAAFGAFLLIFRAVAHRMAPPGAKSEVPKTAALPEVKDPAAPSQGVAQLPLPSTAPADVKGPEVRFQVMAWNSQMGLMLANGGPRTSKGSLMEKGGVNLTLSREDDCNKMQASLLAFATELKSNPQPAGGAHFIAVMGDGSAAWLAGIQPQLEKLGPEYRAEVVGSAGYSRGEDKFMGLPEWKSSPKSARGALIAGVLRDGDWNIAMKWAGDNDIRNNPDETTWDPDALNWLATNDYIEAGQKYITGACEERKVVRDGKPTGESKKVCVNGVVTWTPGDVNVAQQKGGLASIVSTKEYRSQMPNTIIGVKKWDEANRATVEAMLAAMYEAGDQVKAFPAALRRAAEASAAVYKEQDAAYWEKYYKGVTETDKSGLSLPLGGSSVNNLADALALYGLAPGSANVFAATYTTFGDVVVNQYPKLVPAYPRVETVLNTSYTSSIAARAKPSSAADSPRFAGLPVKDVVSKKSWSITFQTGSASFTPEAEAVLKKLANDLLVADELAIEVHGHTDNTGDPSANLSLSERRASAVRDWLMRQSSTSFPATRFTVVKHGQSEPVATNSTEEGRSKNRRVVIVLGTAG